MIRERLEELVHDPLVFTREVKFPEPGEIRIYDSTLRDGEQMPGICFTPEQKLEIAKALSDIGVHIVDMGFPGVSESEQMALRLIMEAKRRGELRHDLEIVVMCRCHRGDIDATVKTLDSIGISPEEVTFFIFTSGSDIHVKYKIGKTLLRREGIPESEFLDRPVQWYREANIRMQVEAIQYARSQGVKRIEFGGEDGSRADVNYIIELFLAGLRAGATRPSFPDTVGCFTPEGVRHYIPAITRAIAPTGLLIHFHNDYGLGTINTITALACGAKAFCVNVNGYGERAGNASLQEVLTALRFLYGLEIPGFKYHKLTELSRLVERYAGVPVAVNAPVVGRNVFTHESGIHAHGVLVDRRIYEAIPSEEIGGRQRFVFGKHSGSQVVEHALRAHERELREAGIDITPELVRRVTAEVKRLREELAATDHAGNIISNYEALLENLWLAESDVVEIARALARPGGGVTGRPRIPVRPARKAAL